MPSKKNIRKKGTRSRSGSKKSRSPYKYNRRNNLLKNISKRKSRSKSKRKSRSKIKKSRSKSRKRYSSSVPRSHKLKSKSPRKLVDISAFQYIKKSPRYSGNEFQWVYKRRKNKGLNSYKRR